MKTQYLILLAVFFLGHHLFAETEVLEKVAQKGVVTYADGSVKKKLPAAESWQFAAADTLIHSGDRIRTYKASRAELALMELDVIRMAPQTTLDIMELYVETREKRRSVKVHLTEGDIWAEVNSSVGEVNFDISTPVAVAAITGTTLRMHVNADSTTQLKVYHGEVKISRQENEKVNASQFKLLEPHEISGPREVEGPHEVSETEWLHIIKAMQQITIDQKGNILNIGNFHVSDLEEQTSWVNWNRQRAEKP